MPLTPQEKSLARWLHTLGDSVENLARDFECGVTEMRQILDTASPSSAPASRRVHVSSFQHGALPSQPVKPVVGREWIRQALDDPEDEEFDDL